ncbi:MAG: c-type cytochrome [Syntrophobacteraceae bacterium]|nr:c-type cytochrome [Desulfobacteraceae bacterium]
MHVFSRIVVLAIIATIISAMAAGVFMTSASAADGRAVFDSLKCGSCHKPGEKSVAVSLAQIARAYETPEQLGGFFKGESKPIIESEKPGMMKGQMPKLGALSAEEQKALAEYILGFK